MQYTEPNIQHHAPKKIPFVPIPSQIISVHVPHPFLSDPLQCPLQALPMSSSGLSVNTSYAFIFSPMCVTYPAHHIILALIAKVTLDDA